MNSFSDFFMIKKLSIFSFLFLSISGLIAQEYDQISIGAEYVDQTYYSIKQGTIQSNDYRVWDISFSTQGLQDGGIFINEAAHLNADSQLELFHVPNGDYNQNVIIDLEAWTQLYNPDQNWQTGAFNTIADENNPLDYGWGIYDPSSSVVSGRSLYVIKLRSNTYKKIFIESLDSEYNFKYANLDGSGEQFISISKSDFVGKTVAHYSLENDQLVNIEPESWDLLFTRYMDYVGDGNGTFLDYSLTGVLSGVNVQVAQADGVNPSDAMESDYIDLYTSQVDEIGYDWKSFNIGMLQWSIAEDRVYFVKNTDNNICKIAFVDFEGSMTGVTTITKECNIVADVTDVANSSLTSVNVFPNPASNYVDLALDFKSKTAGQISILDITGKAHVSLPYVFNSGFQSTRIDLNMPTGNYIILLETADSVRHLPLIITR